MRKRPTKDFFVFRFASYWDRYDRKLPAPTNFVEKQWRKHDLEAFSKLRTLFDLIIKEGKVQPCEELAYFKRIDRLNLIPVEDQNPELVIRFSETVRVLAEQLMLVLENHSMVKSIRKCPVCNGYFTASVHNQIYCHAWCEKEHNWPCEKNRKYIKEFRARLKRMQKQPSKNAVRDPSCQHYKDCLDKAAHADRLLDCRKCDHERTPA